MPRTSIKCVLLCLVLVAFPASAPLVMPLRVQTEDGQRHLELPDGSHLQLSKDSEVVVTFSPLRRHIELVRGEARFHVARNAWRPFIVDTSEARVRTIGTIFNVQVAEHHTGVTLIEGRISVSRFTRPDAPISGGVELQAGQNVRIDQGAPLMLGGGPSLKDVGGWPKWIVTFRDQTLADVVTETNRYRAQPVIIADSKLANMRVNSVLNVYDSEPFWEGLVSADIIRVEHRSDGSVVLSSAR